MGVLTLPLLLLLGLSLNILKLEAFHRSTSRATHRRPSLFASLVQIDLAETFTLTDFLSKFADVKVQGVYVGFNKNGRLVTSDYSFDIVGRAKSLVHDIHSIKIQTFPGEDAEPMKRYLDELMRQLSSEEEDVVISPFESAAPPTIASSTPLKMTKTTVDDVLEEVRPYLIADGGNVRVVSVDEENKVIRLSLQGACGSCPSSTVRTSNQ